jgi:hypothetical protein
MDYPTFTDAVTRFQLFLVDEGHAGNLGWVFPSDVLLVGGKWFVRPRPQEAVVEEVAAAFQGAVAKRLGAKFGVLCKACEDLWCYIYCPLNRTEAEQCLMPDGLKLSVGINPEECRIVVDEREWENLRPQDQCELKAWRFT